MLLLLLLLLLLLYLTVILGEWNEMNEWKCGDLKCVQKPTRGRLSLTHLPVQPLSMVTVVLDDKRALSARRSLPNSNCGKMPSLSILKCMWSAHLTWVCLNCAPYNKKTLAARLWRRLVTAEKGCSFSSGCQSQSSVLMRPCSMSSWALFTQHDNPDL